MNFKILDESICLFSKHPEDELTVLARKVGMALIREKMKVALAESCTGGLVAKTLTDVPGSSKFFELGMVTYSDRIKEEILGVHKKTVDRYSVVSAEVAAEMAQRIRTVAGSELGIGITGVAGPGPDGGHPEGEIYIAVSDGESCAVLKLMTHTDGARDFNRSLAALNALGLIDLYLEDKLY